MGGTRLAGALLRRLDPERAHAIGLWALRQGLVPSAGRIDDPILRIALWGRTFANPVGLAAGFDKDARAVGPLFGLGFGFLEVGSITPQPQAGNPRPRVFRLPDDQSVINRYGFNSRGLDAAAGELTRWRRRSLPGPLGVNLGKNKESPDAGRDYATAAARLAPLADYLVINVSSPNTPGLRALQGRDELARLLGQVRSGLAKSGAAPPLLLKIAPDLTDQDLREIAEVALETKVDGLIATNTTVSRPPSLKGPARHEAGGLSGRALFELSTEVLAKAYRMTHGRVPLIGVGGISSGHDAYRKIRAGASLVQLYTALIYQGPGLVGAINRELAELLRKDGFDSLEEAVGADHR